jgi:hypothetical protein
MMISHPTTEILMHTTTVRFPKLISQNLMAHVQNYGRNVADYFYLYGTHRSMWITVATMHFDGVAARWLQSIQRKLANTTWEEFCSWLVVRFGRNQHQALLRQLYHIEQTSTITDYVDRFSELIDQLSVYEASLDVLHYTTRFIDGLTHSVRAVVAIQKPVDLDTAYSLALLQEEVGEAPRHYQHAHRQQLQLHAPPPMLALPAPRRALPLPAPPTGTSSGQTEHRPAVDQNQKQTTTTSTDAKWIALRNYRRARGECFTYGERWGRDHQCKGTVQLHVLHEVLDLFQAEAPKYDTGAGSSDTQAELHLMMTDTVVKDPSMLTFQLTGEIQGHPVQLLVDSGSTHSFLNNKFIPVLTNVTALKNVLRVKVADGALMQCDQGVLQCHWFCDGHDFQSNFKFLALGTYDGILGLDWLALHSPMNVDWEERWMSFDHKGQHITLQSQQPGQFACTVVELMMMHNSPDSVVQLPDEVKQILENFKTVFAEPVGLPPRRLYDHSIPLIAGAQPVNKKP